MNTTTIELLRAATIQALQNKQDASAVELLALMQPTLVALPVPALPQKTTVDGPAHDYHYWAQFVREKFIPFLTANGRIRFTSSELLSWVENSLETVLTLGDVQEQPGSGRIVWKASVGNGLAALKKQGVLQAESNGKEYEICRALPPVKRPHILEHIRGTR